MKICASMRSSLWVDRAKGEIALGVLEGFFPDDELQIVAPELARSCSVHADVDTGNELWQFEPPAGGAATPTTYRVNGKQFLVITPADQRQLLRCARRLARPRA